MWCDHRQFLAPMRHGLELGVRNLSGAEQAMMGHAVEHPVARLLCRGVEPVRPAKLRRLGESHKECRLAKGEPARLLAEIGKRCGSHAFEISAVWGERQIKREDLILGQAALKLDGAHRLPDLDIK